MLPVDPWAPLVYKIQYTFPTNELVNLSEIAIADTVHNSRLEEGNALSSVTSNNKPHSWPVIQTFLDSISPAINKIIDRWSIEPRPWFVGNSWVNCHSEGGFTAEHQHGRHVAVVTAYITLPENSGFIEFRNPLEYHWSQSYLKEHEDASLWYPVECRANEVLIFPGWLKHRTQASKSNDPRWVITFNISQR
jgi:uncharacterized protein (TIGR02466 family)